MHPILSKTFGGLTAAYYGRQFFFGLLMSVLIGVMATRGPKSAPIFFWVLLATCTALYPYARFVYEGIVGFIVGDNAFLLPLPLMLGAKFFTMALCYAFAMFIAPIGLLYLYIHHTRAERQALQQG